MKPKIKKIKLPKTGSLARELAIVIIVKIIFLFCLWYFFFSTPLKPSDSDMSHQFISTHKEANIS